MNDKQVPDLRSDQVLPTVPLTTTPSSLTSNSDMARYIDEITKRAQDYTKQITNRFIDGESDTETSKHESNNAINDLAAFRRLLAKLSPQYGFGDDNISARSPNQMKIFVRSIRLIELTNIQAVFVHENMYESDNYRQRIVFIRPCYYDFINLIFEDKEKYLRICIIGNPGVGTTLFGIFIIVNALRKYNINVLYWPQQHKPIFFPTIGDPQTDIVIDDYLTKDNLLYLIDHNNPDIDTNCNCKTILLCSSIEMYQANNFHSGPRTVLFYMPMWTLDELTECQAIIYKYLPIKNVKKKFHTFGGFPQIAFREDSTNDLDNLKLAIDQCDINILTFSVKDKSCVTDRSGQIIIRKEAKENHATPINKRYSYIEYYQDFASKWIQSEIVTKFSTQNTKMVKNFIQSSAETAHLGVLRGHFFEAFAHTILPLGGQFKCRHLRNSTDETAEQHTTGNDDSAEVIKLEPVESAERYEKLKDIERGLYNRPLKKNAATFDALIMTSQSIKLFQMTVNKTHPLKIRGLMSLQKTLKGEDTKVVDIYFVVPPDIFEFYIKEQTIKENDTQKLKDCILKLRQYVLQISV